MEHDPISSDHCYGGDTNNGIDASWRSSTARSIEYSPNRGSLSCWIFRASDTVDVESSPRKRTSVAASIVGITATPSESTKAIRSRFCPSSTRSKRNFIANEHCGCVTGTCFALNRSNEPRMFSFPPASTVAASHNVKISTFIIQPAWGDKTPIAINQRIREVKVFTKSLIATRSCFIESRSRNVTVSRSAASFSPSVSKSTVTPNGVPISSWRR